MANSTSSSPSESIPNRPVVVTNLDLAAIGGRYLSAASLRGGDVVGVYLDRNGQLVLSRVIGDDEMPLCIDPCDLDTLAELMIHARDRIRQLVRGGA